MKLNRILPLLSVCAISALAALPPIIDRELLFGDPEISGAQISPDGKYISFMKPLDKTRNIWVKGVSEPFSAARPITAETKRPIPGYFWSRDGKFVLYVKDNDGDENFNIWSVDPAAAAPAGAKVPASRNMTDAKGARASIYSLPKADPNTIYFGLNDRDKAWHDLYKLNIATGEKTLLRKNTEKIAQWFFDNKGNLRLAARTKDNGDTEILRVDADKFTQVYSCGVFENCGPVRFHKDGKRVYMETNKGDAVDLSELVLFDPETMKSEPVESDPMKRVDFGGPIFSDVTDELVGTVYTDEKDRYYWRDKAFESDYKWLKSKLPGKEIGFGSSTTDEVKWIVSASSDVEPGETYLFDRKSKKLELQYRIREKLPRESLSEMKPIRYKSSDGLEIPAYLTLPKGLPAENLPLVVFPHGGPWARDSWGYRSYAQFLANRGYAVLQPNFRGSTGYGKKFLNGGNGQWGRKMQDDLTWGVKHLVAQGTVNPKRVGIMGGSYGGYATLAGVAFTPEVYSAGVAIVAPSNLITLLESIPPYWEAGRKIMYARMASLDTPEGKAELKAMSPLTKAGDIKTPLMVVQGANDPRVNKAESDQIVIALRDRKFPVEYLVAPDEGHGFARPVNNMAMMFASEKFLAKHLDGRFQETATDEVATRLKEITVDPATVTLAKKVDAGAVGLPKIAGGLTPGASSYKAQVALGAQNIPLTMKSEVKDDGGVYTVTDTVGTPMGEAKDTATLDKATLAVMKRSVAQGPVNINVEVKDGKATGTMAGMGQERPISADLGGPLFADSAGAMQSIAALPLADGYATTYRNFDIQKQKSKIQQLKVAGSEQVTVPAGTFDAWKVEITSGEGGPEKTTMWVAKAAKKTVKVVAVMPQMNGATMTAELTQ